MTTIDVGRLLVDLIEDVGRLGGGTDEIVRAILDDLRIAVVALPEPTGRHAGSTFWSYDADRPPVEVRGATMQVRSERFHADVDEDPIPFIASQIAGYRWARKAVRP